MTIERTSNVVLLPGPSGRNHLRELRFTSDESHSLAAPRVFLAKGTLKCLLRFVRTHTIDRGENVFSVKSAFGRLHALSTIASCAWSPSLSANAGCGRNRRLRDEAMIK